MSIRSQTMQTEPNQPDSSPLAGGGDAEADPNTDHGIPPEAQEAEPTGLPTSDRHQVETTPTKT